MAAPRPEAAGGPRRRRTVWLVGALLAAAVCAGAVVWWLTRSSDDGAAADRPRTVPVPAERLRELQTALSSADPAAQAAVLDPAVVASLQASGSPLLPPGSAVRIDTGSSAAVGLSATVHASVTGPQSGDFTLLLAEEDGVWVVYAAVPA
jgi:hypothetical protein